MPTNVIVELRSIENLTPGDDPGLDLEIYGEFYAWAMFQNSQGQWEVREEHPLWIQPEDHPHSITHGAQLHIGATTPEFQIGNTEELWVGGHMKEHDAALNPNDSMGNRMNKIPHDIITEDPQTVTYQESHQKAAAIFHVTIVPRH